MLKRFCHHMSSPGMIDGGRGGGGERGGRGEAGGVCSGRSMKAGISGSGMQMGRSGGGRGG